MAAIPYPRSANLTTYIGSDQVTREGQLLVARFLLFDDPVDLRQQVAVYKHLLRQLRFSCLEDVDCALQKIGTEIGCLFADADDTLFDLPICLLGFALIRSRFWSWMAVKHAFHVFPP